MAEPKNDTASALKDIISHAKEYGFVFPSSEIYDGLQAVYDYGQNGVELKNNLKTLFNLGTEVRDLRKIFLLQGTLLSFFGGIIGLGLGIIIVLIQQRFHIVMITPTLAYPVIFSMQNVLIVLATIFSLGIIASWIASSRVTKKLLE